MLSCFFSLLLFIFIFIKLIFREKFARIEEEAKGDQTGKTKTGNKAEENQFNAQNSESDESDESDDSTTSDSDNEEDTKRDHVKLLFDAKIDVEAALKMKEAKTQSPEDSDSYNEDDLWKCKGF